MPNALQVTVTLDEDTHERLNEVVALGGGGSPEEYARSAVEYCVNRGAVFTSAEAFEAFDTELSK